MKKGFTFIEILVVVTIIGILTAAGSATYTQFMKQTRDARRKADLEQIRAALEMYKSNNASGLYPTKGAGEPPTSIMEGDATYLSKTPTDPKSGSYVYYYESAGVTYTIGAYLEQASTSACGDCDAVGSLPCNYCMGPYGQL